MEKNIEKIVTKKINIFEIHQEKKMEAIQYKISNEIVTKVDTTLSQFETRMIQLSERLCMTLSPLTASPDPQVKIMRSGVSITSAGVT